MLKIHRCDTGCEFQEHGASTARRKVEVGRAQNAIMASIRFRVLFLSIALSARDNLEGTTDENHQMDYAPRDSPLVAPRGCLIYC
jgi:hypothetical protein